MHVTCVVSVIFASMQPCTDGDGCALHGALMTNATVRDETQALSAITMSWRKEITNMCPAMTLQLSGDAHTRN